MKLLSYSIMALLLFCQAAKATEGTIEIIGTGQSIAAAENASIRLVVYSICYETSKGAKDANAVLANQMVELLKRYVRTEKDKVTAVGGVNQRNTEYVNIAGGGSKILCERKWRATNLVSLQTSAIKEVPEIQDKILEVVDKMESIDPNKTAQVYAELLVPSFGLTEATTKKLQKLAQNNALASAKEQLAAFEETCGFKNVHLKSIGFPNFDVMPKSHDNAYKFSTETPIIAEDITIKASWKFLWNFEGSANCYF